MCVWLTVPVWYLGTFCHFFIACFDKRGEGDFLDPFRPADGTSFQKSRGFRFSKFLSWGIIFGLYIYLGISLFVFIQQKRIMISICFVFSWIVIGIQNVLSVFSPKDSCVLYPRCFIYKRYILIYIHVYFILHLSNVKINFIVFQDSVI